MAPILVQQNENSPQQAAGYLFFCRAGTVDEGDLPAAQLEGIVPQPFQPYNLHAASSGVLDPGFAINKKRG